MQIVRNKASISWISSGSDKTGLGRWVWTRHRGKDNITLRIYSAYCTCSPHNSLGSGTVHKQQERYFHRELDDRSPREAFLEDLKSDIEEAQEAGDSFNA